MTLLVRMSGAKKVLEIGALGGYSGICLARGLHEEGKLLSLEINAEFADTARAHLEAAGLGHKVEYRIGDAKETLRELEQEGETFDFFFIDADKAAYPFYLEMALKLAEPGAVIVADNTLMRGKTVDPNQTSKNGSWPCGSLTEQWLAILVWKARCYPPMTDWRLRGSSPSEQSVSRSEPSVRTLPGSRFGFGFSRERG